MLILKVDKHHFYGERHPEGCTPESSCYKIKDDMSTREIEEFIERKTKASDIYTKISWEIMKVVD